MTRYGVITLLACFGIAKASEAHTDDAFSFLQTKAETVRPNSEQLFSHQKKLNKYAEKIFRLADKNNDNSLDRREVAFAASKSLKAGVVPEEVTSTDLLNMITRAAGNDELLQLGELTAVIEEVAQKHVSARETAVSDMDAGETAGDPEIPTPDQILSHKLKLHKFSEKLFKHMDKNGDGVLDLQEIDAGGKILRRKGTVPASLSAAELHQVIREALAEKAPEKAHLRPHEWEEVVRRVAHKARSAERQEVHQEEQQDAAGLQEVEQEEQDPDEEQERLLRSQEQHPEEAQSPEEEQEPEKRLCMLAEINPHVQKMSAGCIKDIDHAIAKNTPLDDARRCQCYLQLPEEIMLDLDCRTMRKKTLTVAEEYQRCRLESA